MLDFHDLPKVTSSPAGLRQESGIRVWFRVVLGRRSMISI